MQVWKMEEEPSGIFMMVVAEESSRATEVKTIRVLVEDNVYFGKYKQYTIASVALEKVAANVQLANPTIPYSCCRGE